MSNQSVTSVEKRLKGKLFSEVVKSSEPSILVFPKKKQASEETRKELKKNIDPTSISINKVTNKIDGGVAIRCADKDSSAKLKNEIEQKLNNYEVKVPNMVKPKVCVMGIENDEEIEQIVCKIKKQNPELTDSKMEVVKTYKNKNKWRNLNAVIELDSDSFHKILSMGKIKVGWVKCAIREFYDLKRCFKCQGYNHKASACKNKMACIKCSGEHDSKDCISSVIKCINCTKMNELFGLDTLCEHEATDKNCPVYIRKFRVLKERIQY